MSGYEAKDRRVYHFPLFDYGAGGGTQTDKIVGPKGKAGRLIDYGVLSIVENFAALTVAPSISIGITTNVTAYGAIMSLVTATTLMGGFTVQNRLRPNAGVSEAASFNALIVAPTIAADTPVQVTSIQGTGSPAGQANPYVVIDWDW